MNMHVLSTDLSSSSFLVAERVSDDKRDDNTILGHPIVVATRVTNMSTTAERLPTIDPRLVNEEEEVSNGGC